MKRISMCQMLATMIALLNIFGCTSYSQYYLQVAQETYPESNSVIIYEYSNIKVDDIYKILFKDYTVVGKSSFYGEYSYPSGATSFAKSIGADILLATHWRRGTARGEIPQTYSHVNTTNYIGSIGGVPFSATGTTTGMTTNYIPYAVEIYDQEGLFLRNTKKLEPFWEVIPKTLKMTGSSELDGTWRNNVYEIEVFNSDKYIAARISKMLYADDEDKQVDIYNPYTKKELKPNPSKLQIGDILYFYENGNGDGIYFYRNKTPMPAKFGMTEYGMIDIQMLDGSARQFARKPN